MTILSILPNLPMLPMLPISLLILAVTGIQTTPPSPSSSSLLPQPPFVRIWTRAFDDRADVIAVRGDHVYGASDSGLWAFELQTGVERWRAFAGADVLDAALHDDRLYAVVRDQSQGGIALYVVDASTGRPSRLASLSQPPVHVTAHDALVFILDETGAVSAFDSRSGALRWSTDLPVPQDTGARGRDLKETPKVISGQLAVAGDALYVSAGNRGELGIDLTQGRVLWFRAPKYAGLHAPIVIDGDVIVSNDDLRRTHVRTGTVVWSSPLAGDVGIVNGVIIGDDDDGLFGRDARNGRVLWRRPKDDDAATVLLMRRERVPMSDARGVWLDQEPITYRAADGEAIWSARDLFTGTPYAVSNGIVITVDGLRVLAYREGKLPPLPSSEADRRRLAADLISRFELLDDAERAQLKALGPYACPLLLRRYVAWARTHDGTPADADSLALYSLLGDTVPLLMTIASPNDTRAIVEARAMLSPDSEWRSRLDHILEVRGDAAVYAPVLAKELRNLPLDQRTESPMLSAVARSSHPDAVALMLETLNDPESAPAWRYEAYAHLAGTGGPEGVDAVRRARAARAPLRPWFDRLELQRLPPTQILSETTSDDGRGWMFFESDILGNDGDLFAAHEGIDAWAQPLFTGVWSRPTFNARLERTFDGMPPREPLVEPLPFAAALDAWQWIAKLGDIAAIFADRDRDGLTDAVEARLGTNPRNRDTDGDGDADAVDPCPNAAPRALNDLRADRGRGNRGPLLRVARARARGDPCPTGHPAVRSLRLRRTGRDLEHQRRRYASGARLRRRRQHHRIPHTGGRLSRRKLTPAVRRDERRRANRADGHQPLLGRQERRRDGGPPQKDRQRMVRRRDEASISFVSKPPCITRIARITSR